MASKPSIDPGPKSDWGGTMALARHPERILMGNEAMARGLVEAGVTLAASYPGTPLRVSVFPPFSKGGIKGGLLRRAALHPRLKEIYQGAPS